MISINKNLIPFYFICLFTLTSSNYTQETQPPKENLLKDTSQKQSDIVEDSSLLSIDEVRKDIEIQNNEKVKLFSIRLLGGIGHSAGEKIHIGTGSLTSYEGIFELTYSVHEMFNIGISSGYLHAYNAIFEEINYDTKKEIEARPLYGSGIQNFTYFQAFFDFAPSIFIIQLGLGPYISLKENSLNKPYFGMNIKLGVEFPITNFISIPLITQIQLIVLDKGTIIIPIKFLLGIKFLFNLF